MTTVQTVALVQNAKAYLLMTHCVAGLDGTSEEEWLGQDMLIPKLYLA